MTRTRTYKVPVNDYQNDGKKIQAWINKTMPWVVELLKDEDPHTGFYIGPGNLNSEEMEEAAEALRMAGWHVWSVNPPQFSLEKLPKYYISKR